MAGQTIVVSVLADTKKFSSAMKRLSAETGLEKLGTAFKKASSKIVGFFKTGIKWAGALLAALVAIALKGGFERMLAIEDATAKLQGLGHSAEAVDQIMTNALNSVKGTAFGLGDAAGLAGTIVAAGVKPGEDLERVLGLVADSATIAGTGLDEMGLIWGKVAAKGKVDGQIVNQMLQRQIPILDQLAEYYGVTAAEVSDMVSAGKVSFEDFAAAMEENVGGAALKSGDTTRGAFENMKAALSRTGEAMLTEVFPLFKDAFQGITGWLDGLTDRVKPFGQAVGAWITDTALPALQRFGAYLRDDLWPVLQEAGRQVADALAGAWEKVSAAFSDVQISGDGFLGIVRTVGDVVAGIVTVVGDVVAWFIKWRDVILPVAAAIAGFVAAIAIVGKIVAVVNAVKGFIAIIKTAKTVWVGLNLAFTASPIGLIVAGIAALVAAFIYLWNTNEGFRNFWIGLWDGIKAAAAAVVDWFAGVGQWFGDTFAAIGEAAQAAADWFAGAWQSIVDFFTNLWNSQFAPAIQMVQDRWDALWGAIKAIWDAVGAPVVEVIAAVFSALGEILATIWQGISKVVAEKIAAVRATIEDVVKRIRAFWDPIWTAVSKKVTDVWNTIYSWISKRVEAVRSYIDSRIRAIQTIWNSIWGAISTKVSEIWNGIRTAVSDKINAVHSLITGWKDRITGFFSGATSWLVSAGRDLIQGLWNGIANAKDWIIGKIGGWKDSILSSIKSFFGIASPSRLFRDEIGAQLIKGLALGLEQTGPVDRALTALQHSIADTDLRLTPSTSLTPSQGDPFATNRAQVATTPTGQPGNIAPQFNIQVDATNRDAQQIADQIVKRQRDALSLYNPALGGIG